MKGLGFPVFAVTMFTAVGLVYGELKILEAVWGIILASGGGIALGEWINHRHDRNEEDFWQQSTAEDARFIPPTFNRHENTYPWWK